VNCDTVQYCGWILALPWNVLPLSSRECGQGAGKLYKQAAQNVAAQNIGIPLQDSTESTYDCSRNDIRAFMKLFVC
jgi:hypothetical protein